MSKFERKRRFTIEPITDSSGTDDQLLVNKKCRRDFVSDIEDSNGDENFHQSHPLIPRSLQSLEDDDSDSDSNQLYIDSGPNSPQFSTGEEETARRQESPINYSFLRDLSSPESKYVTDFQENKQELIQHLYNFYNKTVFENQLPEYLDITWNKRLTKTAGRTGFWEDNERRYAIIQLSDKVCDSADRLRDTIIHEMCHVACWLIDGNGELAHHQLWEQYCEKVAQIHPDLPPITVLHTWEYHYRVIYQCSGCQFRVGRWTDSLDTEKSVCAKCENKMVLVTKSEQIHQ